MINTLDNLGARPTARNVYLFVDLSNVHLGAIGASCAFESPLVEPRLRVELANLKELALLGGRMASGLVVGSTHGDPSSLQRRCTQLGLDSIFLERGARTGREQGNDQTLQVGLAKLIRDAERSPTNDRGIVALLTGDGNGHFRDDGFLPMVRWLSDKGFDVEILTWDNCCHSALRDWSRNHGRYVQLDTYYASLTFVEGGRFPSPLRLRRADFVNRFIRRN